MQKGDGKILSRIEILHDESSDFGNVLLYIVIFSFGGSCIAVHIANDN